MSKDLLVLADEYAAATATIAREAGDKRAVLAEALAALTAAKQAQPEPVNAMLVEALKALLSWVDAYAETSDAEFPDIEAKVNVALTAAKQAQPEPLITVESSLRFRLESEQQKSADLLEEVRELKGKLQQAQPEPPIACMVKGKLLSYKDSLIPEDCFLYLGPQPEQAQPERAPEIDSKEMEDCRKANMVRNLRGEDMKAVKTPREQLAKAIHTNPKPKVPAITEAERLQKLADICKEGEAVGKILKDYYDKNPKALILKELIKQGGQHD